MILSVVKYGNKILSQKIKLLEKEEINPSLNEIISNLKETLLSHDTGVGLAAPQVNISLPIFVALDFRKMAEDNTKEDEKQPIKVYINPEILEKSKECISSVEGCLSVKGIEPIHIYRSAKIKVRYINENFEETEEELKNGLATIFQHEFDHLQGKLIIDYLKPFRKKEIVKKLLLNKQIV